MVNQLKKTKAAVYVKHIFSICLEYVQHMLNI